MCIRDRYQRRVRGKRNRDMPGVVPRHYKPSKRAHRNTRNSLSDPLPCPAEWSDSDSCPERCRGSLQKYLEDQFESPCRDRRDSTVMAFLKENNQYDRLARVACSGGMLKDMQTANGKACFFEVLDSNKQSIPQLLCKRPVNRNEATIMQEVMARAGEEVMPAWRGVPSSYTDEPEMIAMERYKWDLFTLLTTDDAYAQICPLKTVLSLARVIERLHANGVVHRDIKPENVVLSEDLSDLRVIDYEFAEVLPEDGVELPWSCPGTRAYAAPELEEEVVQLTTQVLKQIDVFAFGTTAYAMLRRLMLDVDKRADPPIRFDEPAALIAAALEHDPSKRPTMTQLVAVLADVVEGVPQAPRTPELAAQEFPPLLAETTVKAVTVVARKRPTKRSISECASCASVSEPIESSKRCCLPGYSVIMA
eukprot:TRINITY_DN476_c0_g1_i1.p1 TRINITY_DN476_c0_g1~~TRINITY_DN476_c0_g1_i1.p1  ORF type:complete len:421 (-),score=95.25 TRINITY_DN476_c0_g1_i1:169-1431(-)